MSDAVTVAVQRAAGTKCVRCWRVTEDVGYSTRYPGVCARCVQVLHEIGLPPYRLTSTEGVVELIE